MPEDRLGGVTVPCITPFREDGEVDEEALAPYIEFLAEQVPTISVGAIYGSGLLMQIPQRERVMEIAVAVAGGRANISVFVGALDTDTSVTLAKHAQQAGANALSCVAPIYYRQVDEAIFRHYMAILDAVEIPVYAYDSPVYAGNPLSFEVLERLASIGLAGVITGAASWGLEHVWTTLRRLDGDTFEVWSIRDGLALPGIMMGAKGFESGVGNFFPELVMEFYQAVVRRQYDVATMLQDRMLRLRDISHMLGRNIPTLHALIALRGLKTGVPKRPFFLLSEEEIEGLKSQLASLDFDTPLLK